METVKRVEMFMYGGLWKELVDELQALGANDALKVMATEIREHNFPSISSFRQALHTVYPKTFETKRMRGEDGCLFIARRIRQIDKA